MDPATPQSSSDVKFEIGHVLFIDIVGYSKLRIDEQTDLIQTLREIVRNTEQVRIAEAEGKLLRLPTGDGGALVFRNTLEAPVLCALEISQALRSHPELPVRMGVHSGPVNEVTDLNEQANIAGVGINMAQRVMDCGDAGHILLSKRVADDLEQYPQWRSRLQSLGECEVKHGVRIGLVNLFTDEAGNAEPPARLVVASKAQPIRTGGRLTHFQRTLIILILLVCLGVPALIFTPAILKSYRSKASANTSGPVTAAIAMVPEKSIAVLPFENLSDDKSNAYFADGIQDEILTKLATIADLKVISRTSTAKYKSKPEDLKTVSQQLGVANLVEGTVQRAADKVRVNVQLIDARADSHLWAKSYDRDIKDIFAVESEVSQEIADALQAKLSPNEANTLATAPTKDPEAYDSFLKGEYEEREAESSLKPEPFDRAAVFYKQALIHDPNFALAAARLADNQILRHWYVTRFNETELAEVKKVANHALALAPNLAEGHIALGNFYYYGQRQYDDALKEFHRALELRPNNVKAQEQIAFIYRRQGRWELALSEMAKCEERDPRNAPVVANFGTTYLNLRMWSEAKRAGSRALALDPHNVVGMRAVFLSDLNSGVSLSEAKRTFAGLPPGSTLSNPSQVGNVAAIIGDGTYLYVVERNFAAALQAWSNESSDSGLERSRLAARVAIHVLAGDETTVPDEAAKLRSLVEARVHEQPEDIRALAELSWIALAQKRNADALALAQQAADALPVEKDTMGGPAVLAGLAEIQARAGEPGEAVKTLRRLLSIPAGVCISIARLKIDPVWDPIRNDPGFQQLLIGKEQIGPNK
jgi:TolB-like protein/Tfp pilus assembly protein PilF